MKKQFIVDEIFDTLGVVVEKSEFLSSGLNEQEIYSLVKEGYIERIKKGYYKLSDRDEPKEELLLSKLMTQGIICVESALFYYGYSDFTPRQWTIAIPRNSSRVVKAIDEVVPVKAYYVQNNMYHLGETTGTFNDITLPVYDRERTICDCFKYRTKLDNEIFNKAINAYVADNEKNIPALTNYAKQMGIYPKMMVVMEVMLNG